MVNSRNKGAQGEREWARWLREELGVKDARRGVQHSGGPNSPDVLGVDGVHWEVKRVEKLNLQSAMEQAIRDCGVNIPVVAHRKNRGEWLMTLRADDVIKFCMAIKAAYDDSRT